jgi:hypothetical protein
MLRLVDNPNYTKTPNAIFKATYPMLKGVSKLKPFKAAIKRYLVSSVVTKINIIPSNEWKYATFMPLEKFQGATREKVWVWADKYIK